MTPTCYLNSLKMSNMVVSKEALLQEIIWRQQMTQIINEEASGPDIDTVFHPCFGQGTEEKLDWQPNSFLLVFFLCLSLGLIWACPQHRCSMISSWGLLLKVGDSFCSLLSNMLKYQAGKKKRVPIFPRWGFGLLILPTLWYEQIINLFLPGFPYLGELYTYFPYLWKWGYIL